MKNSGQRVLIALCTFFIVIIILILLAKIKTKARAQSEKLQTLSEKLRGNYLEAFENIQFYLTSTLSITEDTKCEILNDILSMFLDAQQRGESLESVIGQDYKLFCDDIINESKLKNKMSVIIIENLYPFLLAGGLFSIAVSIDTIEKFINKTSSSLNVPVKNSFLFFSISTLFVSYIIIVVIRKKSFSDYKYIYIFFVPLLGLAFSLLPIYIFKTYMNIVLFSIPFYIPVLLSWSLLLGATIFLKKEKNK